MAKLLKVHNSILSRNTLHPSYRVTIGRERITASTLLKQFSSIFLLDGKLQLRYSGLPPVDGCGKEKNSKVVFYFECGNSVGQPEFER